MTSYRFCPCLLVLVRCPPHPHLNLSSTFPSFLPLLYPLFLCHSPCPPSSSLSLSLQGKVAQTACMSACKHLSTSLMQMLLDTELKQISMGAIQQFNLDVIQCECKQKLNVIFILVDVIMLCYSYQKMEACVRCSTWQAD